MKKLLPLLLALTILLSMALPALAVDQSALDAAVSNVAEYVYKTVKNPQVGSIGGEWAVLGLARSGYAVPQSYYDAYYKTVEQYVKACKGVLHEKKYTEYSRVILGLTAAGFDPRNVGGYDLTLALGDFERTIWQGINGPIFALIALDSGGYEIPLNPAAKTQATRELYIREILQRQLADGGFNLTAGSGSREISPTEKADPDLTGMALQALAKYQADPTVQAATEKALVCLSSMQDDTGGYASWGTANSESVVQVLVALCELGIGADDPRFVKNGKTLADNLLSYYKKDAGFLHTANGSGSNQMATEQGLYGIAAMQRVLNGQASLYRMSDVTVEIGEIKPDQSQGLADKHEDIRPMPVAVPGKTFDDVQAHGSQLAIEALAAREIINGKTATAFEPDVSMTRAEFATIVVRALGLPRQSTEIFTDVSAASPYAPFIGSAYTYGIVKGTTDTTFHPGGTITRQDAAVMIARAAGLAGMETELDVMTTRDILSQFGDYVTVPTWAQVSLAFCYQQELLSTDSFDINPTEFVNRAEIADMLFRLLGAAKLL